MPSLCLAALATLALAGCGGGGELSAESTCKDWQSASQAQRQHYLASIPPGPETHVAPGATLYETINNECAHALTTGSGNPKLSEVQ